MEPINEQREEDILKVSREAFDPSKYVVNRDPADMELTPHEEVVLPKHMNTGKTPADYGLNVEPKEWIKGSQEGPYKPSDQSKIIRAMIPIYDRNEASRKAYGESLKELNEFRNTFGIHHRRLRGLIVFERSNMAAEEKLVIKIAEFEEKIEVESRILNDDNISEETKVYVRRNIADYVRLLEFLKR